MNDHHKSDNIPGGNSSVASEIEYDGEVSELSNKKHENRSVIAEVPESEGHSANGERHNFLSSSYGGKNKENYEEAPGINNNISFTKAPSQHLHFAGEDDLGQTLEPIRQIIPRELSEMRQLNNTVLHASSTAIFKQVTEKFEGNDASDAIIHAVNSGEDEEYKEVSVQTAEERLFSCQDSCPICKLQDEDLKKKLTIFCLECPPYKKRRVIGDKSSVNNDFQLSVDDVDETCAEREECGSNEKIVCSDEQILPKHMSFIRNMGGRKRDCREFPCRTIRVGLSRSVKLPSLHKMPSSRKGNIVDSG